MAATTFGKMLSMKNLAVNVIYGDKAWIAGKSRDNENMTIIAFGELIIFLGLGRPLAPAGSLCYSQSIVSQVKNRDLSSVKKCVEPGCVTDLTVTGTFFG
jgi:hypothetical protein